jgi:pullulanase
MEERAKTTLFGVFLIKVIEYLERDRELTISDDSQQRIINAYLESETTLIVSLSKGIILPYQRSKVSISDTTNKQPIGITAIENVSLYRATVVGDMQHLLGAPNDWNTDDNHTSLQEINPNLYQYTASLPAGTYHYKIAFHDGWSDVIPHDQDITLFVSNETTSVTFSYVPHDATTQRPQVYDSINNRTAVLPSSDETPTSLIQITLDAPLDITHTAQISFPDYQAATIIPRNVLNTDRFCYRGDDLGTTFTVQATSFRLWAPTAEDIQLLLYESEDGPLSQQITMQRAEQGTWQATVSQNLENWYYLYQVTVQGQTRTAVDPYARALAVNATRALIVDLQKTHPEGWETDDYQKNEHPVDALIYEVHVRDFSISISSGMSSRGKFLAFTEAETYSSQHLTTGISSLRDLGVTHVQVLPAFEFASVDETAPTQYNWGYDPRNYNVPEGAYATTPHGSARILEYKRMIQSLHAAKLGIVMDVVYNHTFSTGDSDFDKIVPHYYYRTDYAGNYTNGSGCGNEVASERPMVQKFIRDSLKYWMQEYHVDGFRFDLMAILGVDTMQKISQDLHAINPDLLLYGEPWAGGSSALPASQLLTKGQQKNLGLAVFNDNIRNSLIGSAFAHDARGFVTGATDQVEVIKRAISGSIHDFTSSPNETINYASSHDNLTLWDKIAISNAQNSESDRINMDKLAQAIVITSQGIPFLQGGEEFLRTKEGNDNSYRAGDAINQFNWERKSLYKDVFTYYAGLLRLRQHHPAFRMTTAQDIDKYLNYLACPINAIAFQLGAYANQDSWKYILVIYNPNTYAISFSLPAGNWIIVGTQNQINEQGTQQISGTITVTGISCMIFYQA